MNNSYWENIKIDSVSHELLTLDKKPFKNKNNCKLSFNSKFCDLNKLNIFLKNYSEIRDILSHFFIILIERMKKSSKCAMNLKRNTKIDENLFKNLNCCLNY